MKKPQNQIFTPELIRIVKIFGGISIVLVLFLSFFNEKRANNTGKSISILHVGDAERIFFKNVRVANYDVEVSQDAKLTIYRHRNRTLMEGHEGAFLNLSIFLNRDNNEAIIYVEASQEEIPLHLKWFNKETHEQGELKFEGGDKFSHFDFVQKFYPLLAEDYSIQILENENWVIFLTDYKEREVLKTICMDYYRMINFSN